MAGGTGSGWLSGSISLVTGGVGEPGFAGVSTIMRSRRASCSESGCHRDLTVPLGVLCVSWRDTA